MEVTRNTINDNGYIVKHVATGDKCGYCNGNGMFEESNCHTGYYYVEKCDECDGLGVINATVETIQTNEYEAEFTTHYCKHGNRLLCDVKDCERHFEIPF